MERTEQQEHQYQLVQSMKIEIKSRASLQSFYRLQRKTVHYTGERTLSPDDARMEHSMNRYSLRYLYLAYGKIRNKTPEQIEGKHPVVFGKIVNAPDETLIDKIIAKHEKALCGDPVRLAV